MGAAVKLSIVKNTSTFTTESVMLMLRCALNDSNQNPWTKDSWGKAARFVVTKTAGSPRIWNRVTARGHEVTLRLPPRTMTLEGEAPWPDAFGQTLARVMRWFGAEVAGRKQRAQREWDAADVPPWWRELAAMLSTKAAATVDALTDELKARELAEEREKAVDYLARWKKRRQLAESRVKKWETEIKRIDRLTVRREKRFIQSGKLGEQMAGVDLAEIETAFEEALDAVEERKLT